MVVVVNSASCLLHHSFHRIVPLTLLREKLVSHHSSLSLIGGRAFSAHINKVYGSRSFSSTSRTLSSIRPKFRGNDSVAPSNVQSFPCTKSLLTRIFDEETGHGKERSFVVNDVGVVERQYKRWCHELPNVQPFYAVKCNPDATLLQTLCNLGSGFDVASGAEMEAALSMGVNPENIIFANPIKSIVDLKFAKAKGVRMMTFDNEAELYKIKEHHPTAKIVLRLLPDDSGSVMRFGSKFGAPSVHVEKLLSLSQRLGLELIGTSFHIGSGCFDATSYAKAIKLCRETFDKAKSMGLPEFTLLDLGGGLPGNPIPNQRNGDVPAFETFTAIMKESLEEHFPKSTHPNVRIIAEPGRYMATAYSTLFSHVQGKREEPVDPSNPTGPRRFLYYVNDGVYGSFNCIMFDHAHPVPIPAYRFMEDHISLDRVSAHENAPSYQTNNLSMNLQSVMMPSSERHYSFARGIHSSQQRDQNCRGTFFGPTCDSMDVIAKDAEIEELFVGDWLAFEHMGAYTNAAATTFNGMPKPVMVYARSKAPAPSIA